MEQIDALFEIVAQSGQAVRIDRYPDAFHRNKDLDQWEFEFLHHMLEPFGNDSLVHVRIQADWDVHILGSVESDLLDGDLVHGPLGFTGPDEGLDGDRIDSEPAFGDIAQVVVSPPRIEQIVGDHRVEKDIRKRHPVGFQDDRIELDVLSDPSDFRIGQKAGEFFSNGPER